MLIINVFLLCVVVVTAGPTAGHHRPSRPPPGRCPGRRTPAGSTDPTVRRSVPPARSAAAVAACAASWRDSSAKLGDAIGQRRTRGRRTPGQPQQRIDLRVSRRSAGRTEWTMRQRDRRRARAGRRRRRSTPASSGGADAARGRRGRRHRHARAQAHGQHVQTGRDRQRIRAGCRGRAPQASTAHAPASRRGRAPARDRHRSHSAAASSTAVKFMRAPTSSLRSHRRRRAHDVTRSAIRSDHSRPTQASVDPDDAAATRPRARPARSPVAGRRSADPAARRAPAGPASIAAVARAPAMLERHAGREPLPLSDIALGGTHQGGYSQPVCRWPAASTPRAAPNAWAAPNNRQRRASPAATSAPSRARAATARSDTATAPAVSSAATQNARTGCAPTRNSPTSTSRADCKRVTLGRGAPDAPSAPIPQSRRRAHDRGDTGRSSAVARARRCSRGAAGGAAARAVSPIVGEPTGVGTATVVVAGRSGQRSAPATTAARPPAGRSCRHPAAQQTLQLRRRRP